MIRREGGSQVIIPFAPLGFVINRKRLYMCIEILIGNDVDFWNSRDKFIRLAVSTGANRCERGLFLWIRNADGEELNMS